MFSLSDSQAENSTYWALKAGFRLIDTARIYGNEAAVGRGLRRAISEGIVAREEVFITTKMWMSDFDRLVNAATIKPTLLQNETHPYHQSGEMKEHIAQYGTVLESWFPLGARGNTQTLFNDETISSIAKSHGVSSAQVIIRWHLQAGNICIPGSSNEQHIIEDYDVWEFELTEDEMDQMTALERDDRFADY